MWQHWAEWGRSMSNVFPFNVQPTPTMYAKRAEECRWLAAFSHIGYRETYLNLAAKYEQLAKEAETPQPSGTTPW
jgi:hypothetical protein